MKHGHTVGTKPERKALQAAIRRYEALGVQIAQALAGKTPDELLAYAKQQVTQEKSQ